MRKIPLSFSFLVFFILWAGWVDRGVQASPTFLPGLSVGTVESSDIDEASGIAASRKNVNVLWTHNDSAEDGHNEARFFALTPQGRHLGMYYLPGVTNLDWEDMALGPGPVPGIDYLFVGDIGNNEGMHTYATIYRIPEPVVSATQDPVTMDLTGIESFKLYYPDGTMLDADTLIVDPVNSDLYLITRETNPNRPGLYRAPASQLINGASITLERKANLPTSWSSSNVDGQPTGGDISPDGDEIIIRGYHKASLWSRPPGTNLWDAFSNTETVIPVAIDPHGEAIGFDSQGLGYYTLSDNAIHQPVYYYARVPTTVSGVITYVPYEISGYPLNNVTVTIVQNGTVVESHPVTLTDTSTSYSFSTFMVGTVDLVIDRNSATGWFGDTTSILLVASGTATANFTLIHAEPGDADMDGMVYDSDVDILNGCYGIVDGTAVWCIGDFDGDGNVYDSDVDILNGCYGLGVE